MILIDAEELTDYYNRMINILDSKNALPEQITEFAVARKYIQWALNTALTVSAATPTCQNCKYRSEFNIGDKYSCQLGGYVTLTDFCSRGVAIDDLQ